MSTPARLGSRQSRPPWQGAVPGSTGTAFDATADACLRQSCRCNVGYCADATSCSGRSFSGSTRRVVPFQLLLLFNLRLLRSHYTRYRWRRISCMSTVYFEMFLWMLWYSLDACGSRSSSADGVTGIHTFRCLKFHPVSCAFSRCQFLQTPISSDLMLCTSENVTAAGRSLLIQHCHCWSLGLTSTWALGHLLNDSLCVKAMYRECTACIA